MCNKDKIANLQSNQTISTERHVDATIMRSFQTEPFSSFLPSTYVGHVNMATVKHWQFMVALLNSLFFVFKILFLPKYRVIYYYYIVKWCSGI